MRRVDGRKTAGDVWYPRFRAIAVSAALLTGIIGAFASRAGAQELESLVMIRTVPEVRGITFVLDGEEFSSDENGLAITTVAPGTYELEVASPRWRVAGWYADFVRWSDGSVATTRDITVDTSTSLEAGFETSYQTSWTFIDENGEPVEASRVGSVTLVDNSGTRSVFSEPGAHFLKGTTLVPQDGGLDIENLSYRIEKATVDGGDVASQIPRKIDVGEAQRWSVKTGPSLGGSSAGSGAPTEKDPTRRPPVSGMDAAFVLGLAVVNVAVAFLFVKRRRVRASMNTTAETKDESADDGYVRAGPRDGRVVEGWPQQSPARDVLSPEVANVPHPEGAEAVTNPSDSSVRIPEVNHLTHLSVGEQASDPPRSIGGYVLLHLLDRGERGPVYKASDPLGRRLAIKVLPNVTGGDFSVLEPVRQRAEAASQIEHDNIVPIYDFGSYGDSFYVVSQYADGESLAEVMERRGLLWPLEAAELASEVAAGLEAAHVRGLVHGAIKPGQLIVSPWSRALITDLGLPSVVESPSGEGWEITAKNGSGTVWPSGSGVRSASYLSPEQARGELPDVRSDIYSLGIVLWEMLTASSQVDTIRRVGLSWNDIGSLEPAESRAGNNKVPSELESVVRKAAAPDPEQRFSSASEMLRQLEDFLRTARAASGGR